MGLCLPFVPAAAVLLLFGCAVAPSAAHVRVDWPTPRSSSSGLKEPAPCGGVPASGYRTVVSAGQPLRVVFTETVYHTGFFNVSVAPGTNPGAGDFVEVSPDDGCIEDGHSNNLGTVEHTITPPASVCPVGGRCVVRVLQYMAGSNTNYYSCSDLEVVSAANYSAMMAACSAPCANPDFTLGSDACVCNRYSLANASNPNIPSVSNPGGTLTCYTPPAPPSNGTNSAGTFSNAASTSTTAAGPALTSLLLLLLLLAVALHGQ